MGGKYSTHVLNRTGETIEIIFGFTVKDKNKEQSATTRDLLRDNEIKRYDMEGKPDAMVTVSVYETKGAAFPVRQRSEPADTSFIIEKHDGDFYIYRAKHGTADVIDR